MCVHGYNFENIILWQKTDEHVTGQKFGEIIL